MVNSKVTVVCLHPHLSVNLKALLQMPITKTLSDWDQALDLEIKGIQCLVTITTNNRQCLEIITNNPIIISNHLCLVAAQIQDLEVTRVGFQALVNPAILIVHLVAILRQIQIIKVALEDLELLHRLPDQVEVGPCLGASLIQANKIIISNLLQVHLCLAIIMVNKQMQVLLEHKVVVCLVIIKIQIPILCLVHQILKLIRGRCLVIQIIKIRAHQCLVPKTTIKIKDHQFLAITKIIIKIQALHSARKQPKIPVVQLLELYFKVILNLHKLVDYLVEIKIKLIQLLHPLVISLVIQLAIQCLVVHLQTINNNPLLQLNKPMLLDNKQEEHQHLVH